MLQHPAVKCDYSETKAARELEPTVYTSLVITIGKLISYFLLLCSVVDFNNSQSALAIFIHLNVFKSLYTECLVLL